MLVCNSVGMFPCDSDSYSVGLLIGLLVTMLACYSVALSVAPLACCRDSL